MFRSHNLPEVKEPKDVVIDMFLEEKQSETEILLNQLEELNKGIETVENIIENFKQSQWDKRDKWLCFFILAFYGLLARSIERFVTQGKESVEGIVEIISCICLGACMGKRDYQIASDKSVNNETKNTLRNIANKTKVNQDWNFYSINFDDLIVYLEHLQNKKIDIEALPIYKKYMQNKRINTFLMGSSEHAEESTAIRHNFFRHPKLYERNLITLIMEFLSEEIASKRKKHLKK